MQSSLGLVQLAVGMLTPHCSGAQWLNKLVGEAWPFYDRAICDIIKETVTPIMEQYKPPVIIKSMYFKTLTFGDAPIQVDNVWIEQDAENHILMEVGPLLGQLLV